jgi:hypothetical protein
MNLRWNGAFRRFEAEFSTDFQGDLAAVKAVGFKTDGPPEWIWYSYKAESLKKLRENRPASGLTITPEAREQFTSLVTVEEKNAKLKAELAAHNKELKKKLKITDQDAKTASGPKMKMCAEGYMCISAEDLPPVETTYTKYVAPIWDGPRCSICQSALLPFELHNPNICMWCEKTVLDNQTEVC